MAAPLAAVAVAPEAVKLASSVTAHVAAALGTPVLQSTTTRTRTTKRGVVVQQSGVSVPAWALVAGGVLFLWATRNPTSSPGLGWYSLVPFGGLLKEWGVVR